MFTKHVLIVLAKSAFDETEFAAVKYTLLRAGIPFSVTSDAANCAVGSSGMKVRQDILPENICVRNFRALIIIGGKGIKEYVNNMQLRSTIQQFSRENKIIAAICAAPVLLASAGVLKKGTCNPACKKEFTSHGAEFLDDPVVQINNTVTAQHASAASLFASAVIDAIQRT